MAGLCSIHLKNKKFYRALMASIENNCLLHNLIVCFYCEAIEKLERRPPQLVYGHGNGPVDC